MALFPRPRIKLITSERLALVKTSDTQRFSVICGQCETKFHFIWLVRVHPVIKPAPLRVGAIQFPVGQLIRLRADGLELSSGFRQGNRDIYVNWFLNHPPDIRSSNQLEVAASEFECQGLELDWVGLCWGGDFSYEVTTGGWTFRNFSGSRWGSLKNEIDRQYLLNTYRVLLTRARRGLVLWIPQGDISDETRLPNSFDSTADYLIRRGLPVI